MIGKWHLGEWHKEHLPMQRGFESHYGHYGALIDSFTHKRGEVLDWHRNGNPVIEEGYSTYLFADEFERFIEDDDGEKPFFVYVPFNAVHGPHQAPDEILQKYSGPMGSRLAQLECMDIAIGRMLDAIDRKGIRENTLIFFFNDNGAPDGIGNAPYRGGKSSFHEGGMRVAAVMRWPDKISEGSSVDEPLHVVNIYPTFVNLAGGSLDQLLPLDGTDVWATITDGTTAPSEELVYSLKAIRKGDWKYIDQEADYYSFKIDENQLFNIKEDPYEKTNLAEEHPEIVVELQERLKYHATFSREAEEIRMIPDFPPTVYGEDENRDLVQRLGK